MLHPHLIEALAVDLATVGGMSQPSTKSFGTTNERGAGYAADDYAWLKGLDTIVTTFRVGGLPALNAIADAYAEPVPVIHIVRTPSPAARKARALLHHKLTGAGTGHFGEVASADIAAQPEAHEHTVKGRVNDAVRDSYSRFVPGQGRRTWRCGRGRPAARHPVGRARGQGGQLPVDSAGRGLGSVEVPAAIEREGASAQGARVAEPARAEGPADRVGAVVGEYDAAAPGKAMMVLTARELDVLKVIAEGLSNSEIAKRLCLSGHTVHRHVANMLRKLNLPSRAAAAAWGVRAGLV